MNIKAIGLGVLMLIACFHVVDAQGYQVMNAFIETESGKRTVEIRYTPGNEEWAKDIFNTVRKGFPLLEEHIGVPCPVDWDIKIIEASSLKQGVGGVNRGPEGIEVPADTSPGVIIHELSHYWFGHQLSLKWSNWVLEGFPEAYTVYILRELGHPEAYSLWYSRLDQYEEARAAIGDLPLSEVGYTPNFEDPRVGLLYSKAMVFSTWLILYFGEETMHTINQRVIFENPLYSEDYQAIVEEITGEDLDWLFSGWVYPGDYFYQEEKVSFQWFAGDGDNDGINTMEEIRQGMSPLVGDTDRDGLPDGYEVLIRTDPDSRDTDNDGLDDAEEVLVNIDGKNTEWGEPILSDEKNDDPLPDSQDIKGVYATADKRYLYFMIDMDRPSTAFHTGIRIDIDNDGQTDFIFFRVYDNLHLSTWEEGEWVETIVDPSLLRGTFMVVDSVMEFKVPRRMSQVTFPDTFTMWAYEVSVVKGELGDRTSTVTLSTNELVQEMSNPLNPDTDGDGLLDGVDPDPLVPLVVPSADTQSQEPLEEAQEPQPSELPLQSPEPSPESPRETPLAGWAVAVGMVLFLRLNRAR
ncbi:MAG: hypothetical protein HXS51_07500 [Theionarchaea archaeon]|nr:hypothetical protein [Theionarchaea archaeon]MBU7000591.1 hypothetical protein [Theionarchaea archaeon]